MLPAPAPPRAGEAVRVGLGQDEGWGGPWRWWVGCVMEKMLVLRMNAMEKKLLLVNRFCHTQIDTHTQTYIS